MKTKTIFLVMPVLVIVVLVGYFLFKNTKSLSDVECAKFVDCRVSNNEFGRSKTTFTNDSGIYPVVSMTKNILQCGKQMAVVLLDDKGNEILERSYNSPPGGRGGETGYGDYNLSKNLKTGTYTLECYYGDALAKTLSIVLK